MSSIDLTTGVQIPTKTKLVSSISDLENIDSSVYYKINGFIDTSSTPIEVPSGGFYFGGDSYFTSGLYSSEDNYTMFVNKPGEYAGNILSKGVELFVNGSNSKYFDLDNQQNNASFEMTSTNIGRAFQNSSSIGNLANYRQFRTDDFAFFSLTDGLSFDGVWGGGFSVTGTIMLFNTAPGVTLFKEGAGLVFNGSSISNINALSVQDDAIIFGFQDSNFSRDEGFILDGARFKIGTNPIPNMTASTTKKKFKNCSGIRNTYISSEWEVTAQAPTILMMSSAAKAQGVTTYKNEVYFSHTTDNAFVFNSSIEKECVVAGQVIISGTANNSITVTIRKFDSESGLYEDIREFTRILNNIVGPLDLGYFDIYAPLVVRQNDIIEVWLTNNTMTANATIIDGSFLHIDERS